MDADYQIESDFRPYQRQITRGDERLTVDSLNDSQRFNRDSLDELRLSGDANVQRDSSELEEYEIEQPEFLRQETTTKDLLISNDLTFQKQQKQQAASALMMRKLKYQVIIIAMAIIRMFLLGMVQNQSQQVGISEIDNSYMTIGVFSILLFSQAIDNVKSVKQIYLVIESAIAFTVFSIGVRLLVKTNPTAIQIFETRAMFCVIFLSSTYCLIQAIQIFNWYSKRKIGFLLGICQLAMSLGYLTKFALLGEINQYPFDDKLQQNNYGTMLVVLGVVWIFLTVLDYWLFIYHPFEINILIDLDDLLQDERMVLVELVQENELQNYNTNLFERHRNDSILDQQSNQNVQVSKNTSYSFLRVFQNNEVRAVLLYTTWIMLAITMQFNHPPTQNANKYRNFFLYGGMLGFATVGILTDVIARGKYLYTCIIMLQAVGQLLLLINIIYLIATGKNLFMNNALNNFTFGYFSSVGWLMVYVLLPLFIMGKEREKQSYWDIPMAAQIISVINAYQILFSQLMSSMFEKIQSQSVVFQIIPFTFSIIAAFQLWPYLIEEWASYRNKQKISTL